MVRLSADQAHVLIREARAIPGRPEEHLARFVARFVHPRRRAEAVSLLLAAMAAAGWPLARREQFRRLVEF